MKNSQNTDFQIRHNKWIAAPAIHQRYIDHWVNGKILRIAAYVCSGCNRSQPRDGLRLIEDGPGVICRDCYVRGRRCMVPGCDEVAMHREDVCRNHLFFDGWNREEALEEIACRRLEPVIDEGRAPRLKATKGIDLVKQTSRAMRRLGVPMGSNVGLERSRRRHDDGAKSQEDTSSHWNTGDAQ